MTEKHKPIGKVEDPEDKSQIERIGNLLERRNEVLRARDRAKDEYQMGDASKIQAISHYQARLETLILDLWTKFNHDLIEGGGEYLSDKHIATIEIPPPPEANMDSEHVAPGAELPDAKTVDIEGLLWFKDNNPVIKRQFTVRTWNPPGQQTFPNQRVLGFDILDDAVAVCFEFMDEAGIDLDITAQEYTAEGDPGA